MMPFAPSRSRLRRAHSSAIAALLRFSMEMWAGSSLARVLQTPAVQGEQLRLGDFRDHPGEFFLHQLVAGERLVVELFAQW